MQNQTNNSSSSPDNSPVSNMNMNTSNNSRRKLNPADQLKSRLFEKGVGHSSMSYFKSPLSTDYANRVLLVNLNSSKYSILFIFSSSKFSPKVIRKQVAGLPNNANNDNSPKVNDKKAMNNSSNINQGAYSQVKDRLKTTSYDKFWPNNSNSTNK